MLPRNSQKRYYLPEAIYSITITTQGRLEYFKENIFCDLFIEELKLTKKLKGFKLYAFNILLDHVHLLIKPGDEYNISRIVQSIKKEFSRDINYVLNPEGAIPESRLRGQQYSRRRNKTFFIPALKKYKLNPNQFTKFQWQKSFHDHIIRNQKDFQNHYRYITLNHLKHNLPENWQYHLLNYNNLTDKYN